MSTSIDISELKFEHPVLVIIPTNLLEKGYEDQFIDEFKNALAQVLILRGVPQVDFIASHSFPNFDMDLWRAFANYHTVMSISEQTGSLEVTVEKHRMELDTPIGAKLLY